MKYVDGEGSEGEAHFQFSLFLINTCLNFIKLARAMHLSITVRNEREGHEIKIRPVVCCQSASGHISKGQNTFISSAMLRPNTNIYKMGEERKIGLGGGSWRLQLKDSSLKSVFQIDCALEQGGGVYRPEPRTTVRNGKRQVFAFLRQSERWAIKGGKWERTTLWWQERGPQGSDSLVWKVLICNSQFSW